MKKLIYILLIIPNLLLSQDKSETILKQVSSKTSSYSNIEAHFTNSITNKIADLNISEKGILYLKDDLYRIEMGGQTIISDGENNWIHLIDENEVQITETDEENESVNPSKMFTLYEEGYNHQFISENEEIYIIDLTPKISNSFIKIELRIKKKEMHISGFTLFDKNGGEYIYNVDKFIPNQDMKDELFQFNSSKYPGIEVIDLR